MIEPFDALRPELARLDVLIEREMRRMRDRLDPAAAAHATDDRPADLGDLRAADQSSRWSLLARILDLDDDERDLFLVVAAPELMPRYAPIYAWLNDDAARPWPTADLAVRVVARDDSHAVALRGLLLPNGRLRVLGLVEAADAAAPRGQRALHPAPPLADWLRGLAYVDERLDGVADFGAFEPRLPDDALPAEMRALFGGIGDRLRVRDAVTPMLIIADRARDACFYAEEIFARARRLVLVIGVAALAARPNVGDVLRAAALQARLLGLGIVLHCDESLASPQERLPVAAAAMLRDFAARLDAVAITADGSTDVAPVFDGIALLRIAVPEMTALERAVLWRDALAQDVRCTEAPSHRALAGVADRFPLGPTRILPAAAAAAERAQLDDMDAPDAAALLAAARAVSQGSHGPEAGLVRKQYRWDDLILPRPLAQRLEEIVAAIECRAQVLDQWGLARRTGGERGIAIMFAGPSGTGKTMAANGLAARLGIDMHQINIGAILSKYIGETEKNLENAFRIARERNAMLFFDEADALFGKRSETRSAQDRYANIEVAYLLQKMESHDGIIVVATNLARNFDEAFSRRIHHMVHFAAPNATTRERLWRAMLDGVPSGNDIDFAFVSTAFELTGGEIRNVVLDAAYAAAHAGTTIGFGAIVRAIERQYAKRGQVLTPADLREYYPLLGAPSGPAADTRALPHAA